MSQIKDRDRVRTLAEVFTAAEQVNGMLDLIAPIVRNLDATFLEPACGNGNFIAEILRRKLQTIRRPRDVADLESFEHKTLRALSSIHGIDIDVDNVSETRDRVRTIVFEHHSYKANSVRSSDEFRSAVEVILKANLLVGDAIFGTDAITVTKWIPAPDFSFARLHLPLADLMSPNRLDIASPLGLPPTHYSRLRPQRRPTSRPQMSLGDVFDVVVTNPPYQAPDGGHGASSTPLYQKFVESGLALRPKYVLMITPSRWFVGGRGLDKFRARMMSDRQISHIVDYPDATDCFPGVKIRGGVSYFLWQRGRDGDCLITTKRAGRPDSQSIRPLDDYDVVVRSNESIQILDKVLARGEPSLQTQVSQLKPFGLRTNFEDYSTTQQASSDVSLYVRGRKVAWVAREAIQSNHQWIDDYKVLVHRAYGELGHGPFSVIAKPFVVPPGSACTETYLVLGAFAEESQAQNLTDYLCTRFSRFLLSMRMQTQDLSRGRFSFVPRLDMTIRWSDEALFERYRLTQSEREFIEHQIKLM